MNLSWINDFIYWIVNWFPRIDICRATHRGVKFVRGKRVKEVRPGLFMYWPAITEVEVIPVVRQSIDLPSQVLTTKDAKSVMVSAVFVIEIVDIVKALGESWDIVDIIMETGGAAVVESVSKRTKNEMMKCLCGELRQELTRKARKLLRPYGVRVIEGRLTDYSECLVVRNVSDMGNSGPIIPMMEQ
jgi:regulator of protease activity HflC (stomatin/prohibitin superfamily)